MNNRISAQDLILQRSPTLADHSFSLAGTFTLQDRGEAIEQSSAEFYEMVSKRIVLSQDNFFSRN